MTTDEIVRALRCISTPEITHLCTGCKYRKSNGCDADEVNKDAIRLIEQLCVDKTELRREIEWKDMVIALAQRKQAEAEAERDALREKVPQWVSVQDVSKLPQDHLKRYLIAFKDAGGAIVDMARHIPGDGWRCDNWDVPQELITHWMPLPEAPKEGEKEDA